MTLDLAFAVSMLLGLFGMATMWMATGHSARQRKFAPLVGLVAQFAWGFYAWLLGPKAGGLWILVVLYAGVYARGVWVQWGVRRRLRCLMGRHVWAEVQETTTQTEYLRMFVTHEVCVNCGKRD